jgi:hypothetical protein
MGLLSSIGKGIAKVLDTTTVALAHPVKTITAVVSPKSTINDVIKSHFEQPLSKQITQTVIGTAGIAATVVGGGAIATASKAGSLGTLAKSIIPTTFKGKVVAAAVAPVVVSAGVTNPKKALEAPSKILNFQSNVGSLIAEPSLEKAKETFKENPIISSLVVGAGALAVGKGTAGIVASVMNTQAVKENTMASQVPQTTALPVTMPSFTNEGIKEAQPQTPETKTISNNAPKTRRKASRKKEKAMGNINQRVNVIVSSRSSSTGIHTKRYLNERLLN